MTFDATFDAWEAAVEQRGTVRFPCLCLASIVLRGRARARPPQEVIHLQVPLQIPCYDLTFLAESQFEHPNARRPH